MNVTKIKDNMKNNYAKVVQKDMEGRKQGLTQDYFLDVPQVFAFQVFTAGMEKIRTYTLIM